MSLGSNRLQKNFVWNTIGSTVYAFTSLFFLVIVARVNGADEAGIFTFAFSNACVFQVIGLYAGRSYQVTEKDPTLNDNAYFYNRLISVLAMIILGTAFAFVRGYDSYKFLVVFLLILYKGLDAFAEVLYGIVQENNRLYQAGISLFLKGLLGPLVFLIVDLLTRNLVFASLSLSFVSISIMLLYDFRIARACGYRIKAINWHPSLLIFRLGFFVFLFTFLTQYLINAPKYAIDSALSPEQQTIYGIIAMPATFMVLVGNLIIFPFLTKIKGLLEQHKIKTMNLLILKISSAVCVLGFLAVLAAVFLAVPVFNLLYGVDISDHLSGLALIIVGATAFSLTIVLSNALIAMRRTISQAVIFIVSSLVAFVASGIFVEHYGLFGGVLTYLFTMFLLLTLYIVIYVLAIRKEKSHA